MLRPGEVPILPRTPDNRVTSEVLDLEGKWRLVMNGDDVEWEVNKSGVWTPTGAKWIYTDY